MNSITLLMNEHRFIEQLLDALEGYNRALQGGAALPRRDLEGFARFFSDYADRHHHGKEERILFDAMTHHGFSTEVGPVAVMLAEHVDGRAHVRKLRVLAAASTPWTDAERRAVDASASAYATLLRHHIMKEDRILYPMAKTHLPAEVMAEVDAATSAFEARSHEGTERAALIALGQELSQRYRADEERPAATP